MKRLEDSRNQNKLVLSRSGVLECIVRLSTFKLVSRGLTEGEAASRAYQDNDKHFVIETTQSDSDSECNLSDTELETVPEQFEDLYHDAGTPGMHEATARTSRYGCLMLNEHWLLRHKALSDCPGTCSTKLTLWLSGVECDKWFPCLETPFTSPP
uniref:Uncharacterized protein n=1 Tax=Timema douglasi TaxID=61478 RepID=A0A7R8VJY3_TIMDO|nr:unnamed protein product [Timema douglasi]